MCEHEDHGIGDNIRILEKTQALLDVFKYIPEDLTEQDLMSAIAQYDGDGSKPYCDLVYCGLDIIRKYNKRKNEFDELRERGLLKLSGSEAAQNVTLEKAIVLLECSVTELVGALASTTNQSAAEQIKRYIAAYDMAISALRFRQDQETNKPLTQFELRDMNGESVYCAELNMEVDVRASRSGLIQIHYRRPGEEWWDRAMDYTLYRHKPVGGS